MLNNTGEQKELKSLRAFTQHINSIPTVEIAEKLGISLHKIGNSLRGDCPTGHGSVSKTCFSINTKDNYWYCHSCKTGGDNISLVRKAIGIGFTDALRWFAKECSLSYTFEVKEKTAEEQEQELRTKFKSILFETAYTWMHEQLFDTEGKEAHYYLTVDRNYDPEILKNSEFCAFPAIKKIREHLLEVHPDLESYIKELPLYGAFGENFELAFPYRDRYSTITGFIKRSSEPGGVTVTTSDGEVLKNQRYDSTSGLKKNDLFGLYKCKNQETLVIVEGYPDAVYFSAHGMENIAAVGQGNLAKSHIEGLTMKGVKNAIISFDNDAVGPNNSERAVKLLLGMSNIVPFVLDPKHLSPHKDPDEYVKANGLEAYKQLLKKAQKGVIWCVERLIKDLDAEDALAKEKAKQDVLDLTTLINDPGDLACIADIVVKTFQIGKHEVKQLINNTKKEQRIDAYKKSRKEMFKEKRYVPFIEKSTSSYSYWDKKADTVHLGIGREILENILASAEQKLPDILPILKVDFDAHQDERINAEREIFNLFVPSKYMLLEKTGKFLDPRKSFPHIYKLLSNLLPNYRERKRFINWLAGILQTRDKQLTAWVFKGTQGTGKGLLLYNVLKPLFGEKQAIQVEDQQLKSEFNPWLQNAMLIAFNEVAHDNDTRNSIKSKLKAIITDSEIIINEKQVRNYTVTNYVNCLFFSNEAVPVFIEEGDRRFNVVRTGEKLEKYKWFNDDREHFLDSLKKEVPEFAQFLMNFKYDTLAAKTCINNAEKQVLVTASMNRFEEFAMHLKNGDAEWFETNSSTDTLQPSIKVDKSDISGGVKKDFALRLFNTIYSNQTVSNIQLGRQLKLYGIDPERVMDKGYRKNFYLW